MECEKSNCVRKAIKVWKGLNVCNDCYDKFREEEERMYLDLPTG